MRSFLVWLGLTQRQYLYNVDKGCALGDLGSFLMELGNHSFIGDRFHLEPGTLVALVFILGIAS